MATTREEVIASTEAFLLKYRGPKARGQFRNYCGCLLPETLQKIDDMCTNNSLTSMVSWLLSQSYSWFTVYKGNRHVTLSSGNYDDMAYMECLRDYPSLMHNVDNRFVLKNYHDD